MGRFEAYKRNQSAISELPDSYRYLSLTPTLGTNFCMADDPGEIFSQMRGEGHSASLAVARSSGTMDLHKRSTPHRYGVRPANRNDL